MDITFESFATLIYRLGHPPKSKTTQTFLSPSQIFTSWLTHLPRPFPDGTGKRLFRLLFPHEGSRRRYGLKEIKLALELERILCIEGLTKWDAAGWGEAGTGCLGKQVEKTMRDRVPSGTKSLLTLTQLDKLLDDLAAHSSFSRLSQPPLHYPSQQQLLVTLFRDSSLSPCAMCLLVQIILRDLRPLLSPLPSLRVRNPTAMLRIKTTAGPAQLDLYSAMKCWHPDMAGMYRRGLGNLDVCADYCEGNFGGPSKSRGPVVGVNVQIPKCRKGRSIEDALKPFLRSGPTGAHQRQGEQALHSVWAETKYDGYRMQIHVQVQDNGLVDLQVFSKSKRNSTSDRLNTHCIILAALGLPIPAHLPRHPALSHRLNRPKQCIKRSIILEAEVVPYNEGRREGGRGPGVEEFWWLGAAGVTSSAWPRFRSDQERHLCLYFFDILHLNGENLLNTPLFRRRRLLERYVAEIDCFSHLANYTVIPLDQGRNVAYSALQAAFDAASFRREEGLVLKAPESTYIDSRWPWVKLKKDYIPDLGDCIDMVLLGAGWDADRARELRVDTSVFTSFYIGVLTNCERVKAKVETPHFDILFKVSYGLDRDVLELVNGNIRHGRWASKPYDKDDRFKRRLLGLSWTYTIRKDLTGPSILFEKPMCAEVMGAGFQRIPDSSHYELRWPRLQKIHDRAERSWTEALTSFELIKAAQRSLGYETSNISTSPKDDSVRALWRSSSAVALTDIPELPTPSPERPSPRRNKSAPDVMGLLKSSPPSPMQHTDADARVDTPPPIARARMPLFEKHANARILVDQIEGEEPRLNLGVPPKRKRNGLGQERDARGKRKKQGENRPVSLGTRIRRAVRLSRS